MQTGPGQQGHWQGISDLNFNTSRDTQFLILPRLGSAMVNEGVLTPPVDQPESDLQRLMSEETLSLMHSEFTIAKNFAMAQMKDETSKGGLGRFRYGS